MYDIVFETKFHMGSFKAPCEGFERDWAGLVDTTKNRRLSRPTQRVTDGRIDRQTDTPLVAIVRSDKMSLMHVPQRSACKLATA